MSWRADFHARAKVALGAFTAQPALAEAVRQETDAFFARYPEIERTELTAAFIGSLAMDRLSPPDSQSGPTQQPHQKVA